MKLIIICIYFFITLFFCSCLTQKNALIDNIDYCKSSRELHDSIKKIWQFEDICRDSIPGISLIKSYRELISSDKGSEVIVAVLDSEMDIYHNELEDCIWINKDEFPNNGIDDDNNGYIDDVNGWNLWGNKDGKSSTYRTNFGYVRVYKKFNPIFENKTIEQISHDSISLFNTYTKARNLYEESLTYQKIGRPDYIGRLEKSFYSHRDTVQKLFPELSGFNIENLKKISTEDEFAKRKIKNLIYYLRINVEQKIIDYKKSNENYLTYYLNKDYNDRINIGDDVNKLNDTLYGHNILFFDSLSPAHATKVTGLICNSLRQNRYKTIKIMPLVTSVNGSEHDKDIALAIKYAVDNGASIINMSFGKQMAMHNEWVLDAIKYAETRNVLIVKSAGNDGHDISQNKEYPNDTDLNGNEIANNFICVGASSSSINKDLITNFSNYSKTEVDLFAPGNGISVAVPGNKYEFDDGTSLSAAITTGVAAIVKSHYPSLKAHEIKEILMESGIAYDIDVELANKKGEKELVPFSSLSKSGKIVNAYNALLMAKNYEKWKKGKWPR